MTASSSFKVYELNDAAVFHPGCKLGRHQLYFCITDSRMTVFSFPYWHACHRRMASLCHALLISGWVMSKSASKRSARVFSRLVIDRLVAGFFDYWASLTLYLQRRIYF